MPDLVLVLLGGILATLPIGVLTAIGQRRRGGGVGLVLLTVVAWPFVWINWYVRDELRPTR